VRRGRSAGILVVLASQRLTADAIPTVIRDICGVRIAGRVTRPEDAELILGRRPGEGVKVIKASTISCNRPATEPGSSAAHSSAI